uniref:CHXC21 n=1 Tax=Albugo laibachii Nc14 TaxID=890382 RepID=F0WL31_9STRA|nr:CHXC21 [Albugo laibachii Nc14]|eukprot:CCA21991.1 CHXC21 [Albugo laibachii Nc14]
MSIKLRLCALTLAVLISSSKTFQDNDMSFLSGVLSVSPGRNNQFTTCHNCIVRAVGINQLRLIKSTADFRMYWFTGHPDIPTAYIWHCNVRTICTSYQAYLRYSR